ncbi:MAG: hypothetical protein SV201_05850 [Pseudomonadota bacterium]|nr:hypothetical protein [Pseudomonadota bacterium]
MKQERVYYLVKGGAVLEAIEEFKEKHRAVHEAGEAFKEKYGGGAVYTSRSCVHGLQFEGEPPEGWFVKKGDPHDCYRPRAKRKACREARKDFDALPVAPGATDFARMINVDLVIADGCRVMFPSFELVDDKYILGIPLQKDGSHDEPHGDCQKLSMSEYWQLKEQVEQAA